MNGASERRRTKQRHPINLPFQIVVDCLLQTVFDHSIEFQKINVTNSTKTFNIMIIIPGKGTKRKKMLEMKLCACFKLQQFFYDLLFAMLRSYRIEMKDMEWKKKTKGKRKKATKIAWNRHFVSNKCDTIHFYCIQCVHIENYRFFLLRLAFRYHCHTYIHLICTYIYEQRERESIWLLSE